MAHMGEILFGCLITGFFTLIWRRLDSIDKTLTLIQKDMTEHFGSIRNLEGRVDEVSKRVH